MASLRSYFNDRMGKALSWTFQPGGSRYGEVVRRDYSIVVTAVDADSVTATVGSVDFDATGRKVSRVPAEHGSASAVHRGASDPMEVLEGLARAADPKTYARHPKSTRTASEEGIDSRIRRLMSAEGHGEEPPPKQESVTRFRAFWAENHGLAMPELFSSSDGTVRARWQSGADRTLWINFPPDGALGFSVSVPRQGNYGLRRMNARCPDNQDIIPFAESLGISCRRG